MCVCWCVYVCVCMCVCVCVCVCMCVCVCVCVCVRCICVYRGEHMEEKLVCEGKNTTYFMNTLNETFTKFKSQ